MFMLRQNMKLTFQTPQLLVTICLGACLLSPCFAAQEGPYRSCCARHANPQPGCHGHEALALGPQPRARCNPAPEGKPGPTPPRPVRARAWGPDKRNLLDRLRKYKCTPEEGRWEGWVHFPSVSEAVRAARWAVGLETTKKQARSHAGQVSYQLKKRPGHPAKYYAGSMRAGVCFSFARAGHCSRGADCRYTHTTNFQFMDADPEMIKLLWARKPWEVDEKAQVTVDGKTKSVRVEAVYPDLQEASIRYSDGETEFVP